MFFLRILSSEWLKTKNTAIRKLMLIMPVLYAVAMLMYIFNYTIKGNAAVTVFDAFIQIWTTIALPIGAGLIAALMIGQEEQAGEFNGFLGTAFSRNVMYLGKLVMIFIVSSISIILAMTLLLIGLKLRTIFIPNAYDIKINLNIFVQGIFLVQITAIPIFIIQLWVAIGAGKGASIGLGCAGTLTAGIIGGTMLGEGSWQFIPWTIPIRTADYLKFFMYDKGNEVKELAIIGFDYVRQEIFTGISAAAIFTLVLIFLTLIWFNRWEGRKVYD